MTFQVGDIILLNDGITGIYPQIRLVTEILLYNEYELSYLNRINGKCIGRHNAYKLYSSIFRGEL